MENPKDVGVKLPKDLGKQMIILYLLWNGAKWKNKRVLTLN